MSEADPRANPYVGLRPFFAADSLYFYGREQQSAELLEILRQHRFLGVVGSSGSGKSSLVRAGLLPALVGGFLVRDRDRWRTIQIKPGDAPIANLAAGLLEALEEAATPDAAAALEQDIRERHAEAVVERLAARLETNSNLLVLVDQFEEIFAFRGSESALDPAGTREAARRRAEATDFVDLLLSLAAHRELPIYVVLTMRTDFLGDCDLFYGLPEALNRGRYLVPRMTREELRDAVECPALLQGVQSAPRLLDHVLNELGDRFDRLPLLQHALLRAWDEWERAGSIGPVDLSHFESAGGLDRALDKDAERALEGLDLAVAERLFKRLTGTDLNRRRIRTPARISELMAATGADRETVDTIVRRFEEDGRSFMHRSADGQPDDPRVDISHESLIRRWDRLSNWVEEERQSRDDYVELVRRAGNWARGRGALLQDPELQTALDSLKKISPTAAWAARYSVSEAEFATSADFVDQSLRARAEVEVRSRWSMLNRWIVAVEVLAGLAIVGGMGLFDENISESIETFWDRGDIFDIIEIMFDPEFASFLLFVLLCLLLNRYARTIHRRIVFQKVLEKSLSYDSEAASSAKLQEAVAERGTTYAPTYRRFAAFVLDFWISIIAFVSLGAILLFAVQALDEGNAFFLSLLAGCFLFTWSYSTFLITSKWEATLGMRALGIFRTDLYGRRLSFGRASTLYGFRLLSYLFYGMGFLVQPFTPRRQAFHDYMAKSVVLRRQPAKSEPAPEAFSSQAELPDDWENAEKQKETEALGVSS